MPVCEQEFEDGVLKQTRIHLLGARGIEGIITVPSTGAPTLNWLFYDGHGNMVSTMNTAFASSTYQWRGVWGERTNSTPGRGYCANLGHLEDEMGLVYMRARYYEPATGRFISEDPARDGVNWYLYADGDAVNRIDFTGKVDDSFDPVYAWLNRWTIEVFGRTVFLFDMLVNAAAFSVIRASAMAAAFLIFGSTWLAVGSVISYAFAVGATAWLGIDVTRLHQARLVAWYLFLFPEEFDL